MSTVPFNSSLFPPRQQSAPPDDDDRCLQYPHAAYQQGPPPYRSYVEPSISYPSHPTTSTPIDVSARRSQEKRWQEKLHGGTSTIHNDRRAVSSSIASSPGTLFCHSQLRIDRCLAETLDARSMTDEYPIEITPHQCFSKIGALLCCPSRITAARSLHGNEAQEFVDLLDQTLAQSYLDEKLQHRSLLLLSKICKARAIIPSSYKLQSEFIRVGRVYCHGGFADVSDGEYRGSPVAIKYLRISVDESDRVFKRLCREIIAWKHLSHKNILPSLGVSVSMHLYRFRILTKWMSNGDIIRYTKLNPKVNRLRLLSEVASGTAYLHQFGIVHGDLKGANILVDDDGTALLADFGLMTILVEHSAVPFSVTVASAAGTVRWMSPELLFGTNIAPSRQSDRYALGMVVYEVLTGLRPFHRLGPFAVAVAVQKGKRPGKPANAETLGFSDPLWGLVLRCWNKSPTARPTAQELLCHLESATRTWVPPSEYPITDGLEGDVQVESASDESNKTGALARNFLVLVLGILQIFISPFT